MRFVVERRDISKSNVPHEIFLANLIGNHFLMSVAVGELYHQYPWTILFVPAISILLIGYSFGAACRSRTRESWYVMCHWQIAMRHTKVFLVAQCLCLLLCSAAWLAVTYGGIMKAAAIALVCGGAMLPMFITMLVLILMESEALSQAGRAQLPRWILARCPNPGIPVIEEAPELQS